MRGKLASVVATVMAIATFIFHLIYGSSLWILALRVTVTWLGFAALVLFFDYGLKSILGGTKKPDDSMYQQRKHLDLVSRPDEDSAFFK